LPVRRASNAAPAIMIAADEEASVGSGVRCDGVRCVRRE
jgi:hypothetical protein